MVFIYNGVLFSHKEWNFVICREMDGTGEPHLKGSYPDSEGQT
jgi:hypothetical protein